MTLLQRLFVVVSLSVLSGCSRTEAEIAEEKFQSDSFICERYNLPKVVHKDSSGYKSVYCVLQGVETRPGTVLYLMNSKK